MLALVFEVPSLFDMLRADFAWQASGWNQILTPDSADTEIR